MQSSHSSGDRPASEFKILLFLKIIFTLLSIS